MPDTITNGAYHLADNPNIYEPYRGNAFEFIMGDTSKADQESVRMQVVSFPVAHFSLAVNEIRKGNSVIKFPGLPTFNTGNLVVKDYVGANGKSVLEEWQSKAYNVKRDRIGNLAEIKRDCTVLEYDHTFEKLLKIWNLKGCWVSEISEDDLTRETNGERNITATIVYDKAIPEYPEEEIEL